MSITRETVKRALLEGREEVLDYLRRHQGSEVHMIERPKIEAELNERFPVESLVDEFCNAIKG